MWRSAAVLLISLCIGAIAFAQSNRPAPTPGKPSQPPQSIPQLGQQQPAPDMRGTENTPVIVKVLPTPKSKEEAAQDASDRQDVSAANWWMVRLTGAIGIIGIVQAFVFWVQAGRLKETIKKMDEIAQGQTTDMKNMIAQTTKSATAMARVADGIAENVVNTATMMRTQREFWQKQMRAYVYTAIGVAIYQERGKKIRFEAKPIMTNFGNTRLLHASP